MEQRIIEFVKRHPIIFIIVGFVFNSLPGWLQLFVPTTGGTAVTTITWLSWLPAIVGTGLLITVIIILRKPTLADVPIILQRMHNRINTLARGLIDKGQVHITDDEFKAIVLDFGNITFTDSDLFAQLLEPKSGALDFMKEKAEQINEQIAIFQVQFGMCFEKHKKILSVIKAKDRKYKSMKRQVDTIVYPIPDEKVMDSVKGFTIASDGLNDLLLLKPYLLESSLVKNNLAFSSSMMTYLERLDESIDIQMGKHRIQVAKAIDEYMHQRLADDKG